MSKLEETQKEEVVEQEEKGIIPFEEICPQWSKHIAKDGSFPTKVGSLNIISHARCMVGEAHGFGLGYTGWDGNTRNKCEDCKNFAITIFRTNMENGKEYIVPEQRDGFVKHWNEAHRN